MEKLLIGNILRERMRKCGYTYETFAEKIGINESTIKRYAYGKRAYTYEHLIKFAEALNCSYDFLLGYSCSPEREYHEIKEQIVLSDESINNLCKWSEDSKEDELSEYICKLLDEIICNKSFLMSLMMYCSTNKNIKEMNESIMRASFFDSGIDTNSDMAKDFIRDSSDKLWLMSMIKDIETIKHKMNPELLDATRKSAKAMKKASKTEE